MNGYLIVIILIIAFWAAVHILDKRGILAKHNMSAWGPFLKWNTTRGLEFIDKLSRPRRFWNGFSLLSKGIVAFVMFGMTALLLWESTLVSNISAENAPSVDMILGIPGINPIIPLWYGILGLVVAVVIHEFAHGILARVHDMKVKCLGIIWMVIPMGAFTEPDEDALNKTTVKKRTAVFAVGPGINVVAAVVFAILFSTVAMSAVEPTNDAPLVYNIYDGTPADIAGIPIYSQIISINGVPAEVGEDGRIYIADAPDPNTKATIEYYYNGQIYETEAISGVIITRAYSDLPSGEAGLKAGMMLYSINGEVVKDETTFSQIMDSLTIGDSVPIVAYRYNSETNEYELAEDVSEITPMSRLAYYESMNMGTSGVEDGAFIGVNVAYLGASIQDPNYLIDTLKNPFAGDENLNDYFHSFLTYITLPLSGLQPFPDELVNTFEPQGIFAGMSNGSFWIMANCFYWLFWINLMLGLTNALPAVPLDGGYIFRDWLDSLLKKVRKKMPEKERTTLVDSITWAFALLILFLILWQLIGPRI